VIGSFVRKCLTQEFERWVVSEPDKVYSTEAVVEFVRLKCYFEIRADSGGTVDGS